MDAIGNLRHRLERAYQRLGTWRRVGEAFGISGAMAFRVARRGYEPKDTLIRSRLGLASYAKAPVCLKCGVVHVSRRCTARPALWMKKVWDTPSEELRWRLVNREEFKD